MSLGSPPRCRHARAQRAAITLFAASVLAAAGCASSTHPPGTTDSGGVTIGVLPHTAYPTVEVRFGRSIGTFVLDTGGRDVAIVETTYLRESDRRSRAGRTVKVGRSRYTVRRLTGLTLAGRIALQPTDAIVTELDNLRGLVGNNVHGWLTLAALEDKLLDIDLPNTRAWIGVPTSTKRPATTAPTLPRPTSHAHDPRPFVQLRIGDAVLPALIDTGSYDAIVLPRHLFDTTNSTLHNARQSFGEAGFGSIVAASQRGRVANASIGPIELRDVAVHVVPHSRPNYAVIGIPVLRHFRIIYNVPKRELRLIGPRRVVGATPNAKVVAYLEAMGTQSGN